ncbi:hypothetical protein CASFOL_014719 [Castilleja foliolosa]|uniref:Auxin-responsive protein n=1 Tax=Castilleja foliolosa TaxID=1961234 RepID=A0ABD3DDS3_9LAMI
MEGYARKDNQGCHQFLDLVHKEREWFSEDKKLELSLGPPGGNWTSNTGNNISQKASREEEKNQSFIDYGYFPNSPFAHNLHHLAVMDESSQLCSNRVVAVDLKKSENKVFSTGPANNTAVPNVNSAQKRTAPAPMVGWPPIRSFRKSLASGSSSKLASDSTENVPSKVSDIKKIENRPKTLFVKINMDGVPIGRKVDLKAYDSYEKLSYAVDKLFRGLLEAQGDSTAGKDGKIVDGLLNGNREYTLVYEDNEGDRMLVGDVPWNMFVSTVKRLRVLKSSELPTLSRGSKKEKQIPVDASK